MYTNSKMNDEQKLRKIVKESSTIAEVLRKFGYSSPWNKDVRTSFRNRIKKFNISIDHFKTQEDIRKKNVKVNTLNLDYILSGQHGSYPSSKLRQRLINSGYKENKCESCGIGPFWNNSLLCLHLDHKDGNHANNLLENLQILCPNCHTQTSNYGSKNRKSYRKKMVP